MAIGGGKTNEIQANCAVLSLISRSIVLPLLQQQNLEWGAGTRVLPFLAGARGRVNGGRFAVIAVEKLAQPARMLRSFAHNRRK